MVSYVQVAVWAGLLKTLVCVNHWLNIFTGGYLLTNGHILLVEVNQWSNCLTSGKIPVKVSRSLEVG